jgi:hypothetical protein
MSGRANVRQYLAGRYAAQEAKRAGQARADDHAYATTPAQRAYTLTLPLPPSVNVLYGQSATGQKFLQPKQRDFRHDVAMIVAAARKGDPPLTGRIEMQVTLYDNGKRAWDIDIHGRRQGKSERVGALRGRGRVRMIIRSRLPCPLRFLCSVAAGEILADVGASTHGVFGTGVTSCMTSPLLNPIATATVETFPPPCAMTSFTKVCISARMFSITTELGLSGVGIGKFFVSSVARKHRRVRDAMELLNGVA